MLAPTKFTPAARPPLRKPLPLDFAQLIAQRRANRVAQNTQMQADNNHFWNLKNSIELENAFQEKERMTAHLRLGRVPAHISYPIIAALRAGSRPMEVDEAVRPMEVDGEDLRNRTTILPIDHGPKDYQTNPRARDRKFHPHLEDYDDRDRHLIAQAKAGVAITDKVGLVALNKKNQARNRGYARLLVRLHAGGEA
jgi:hypothetical protein